MRDDADVARVAAALNAPGLRYRSFNNAPVRVYSAIVREALAEEAPAPAMEPVPSAPAMPVRVEAVPLPPTPVLHQDFEYAPIEEPLPIPEPPAPLPVAPVIEELPAVEPAPVAAPAEPPPLFAWPEVPSAAPLLAEIPISTVVAGSMTQPAPAPQPYVAPAPEPAPLALQPAQPAAPEYRLFNAIGRTGEPAAAPSPPQPANTTLAMLRSRIEAAPESPLPFQGLAAALPSSAAPPATAPQPASAVTVPLSDVMRLIAAGSSPPASPFEAFRSALSAQPAR